LPDEKVLNDGDWIIDATVIQRVEEQDVANQLAAANIFCHVAPAAQKIKP